VTIITTLPLPLVILLGCAGIENQERWFGVSLLVLGNNLLTKTKRKFEFQIAGMDKGLLWLTLKCSLVMDIGNAN